MQKNSNSLYKIPEKMEESSFHPFNLSSDLHTEI